MRDLARSMLGFSLELPLFGARQLAALWGPAAERQRASAGLQHVSRTAEAELDGSLRRLAEIGSCIQGGIAQMGPSLLTPELLLPSTWVRLAGDVAVRSTEGLRLLPQGTAALSVRELRSKAEVFCLVLDVSRRIGVPPQPPFPLRELIGRAYALDAFSALWAVEGLGHDYGDIVRAQGVTPHAILREEVTGELPACSLLMLHAGIGLSFAQHGLDGIGRSTPPDELRGLVAEIVRLCRDNSRPGWEGAAFESLGLVTRTFHGDQVQAVDRALRDVAPEILGHYWHGVGRALYFLPINFLPFSNGQVFALARDEAPDEEARRSAVAGAAWASALVGQREPDILAELVVRPYGEELARDGAFANGIASSSMMRFDTTPGAPFLADFYRYQPADPGVARLWEELVRRPTEEALQRFYPVLRERRQLGEMFREQDLAALVARLEREGRA